MLSKVLVLSCVCALALMACTKKDAKKSSDDTGMATAAMNPAPDDGMKDDAMRPGPAGQFDAKAAAEQVLQMQAILTKVMVAALPDCDKAAASAMALLDEPKWKKVAERVKANKDAVKTAQSVLIKTDRSKSAFMRGRIKVMIKCKGNPKHAAIAKRLGAMWK
jgi:hypothetical protein